MKSFFFLHVVLNFFARIFVYVSRKFFFFQRVLFSFLQGFFLFCNRVLFVLQVFLQRLFFCFSASFFVFAFFRKMLFFFRKGFSLFSAISFWQGVVHFCDWCFFSFQGFFFCSGVLYLFALE